MIPAFSKNMTIGEKYESAMEVTEPEEAKRYFELAVLHTMAVGKVSKEKAIEIEKQNFGYFAGYYDAETRLRVEKLFECQHPIFGKASNGVPTAEEAFQAGQEFAMKSIINSKK